MIFFLDGASNIMYLVEDRVVWTPKNHGMLNKPKRKYQTSERNNELIPKNEKWYP
jgi:hypothetical protein